MNATVHPPGVPGLDEAGLDEFGADEFGGDEFGGRLELRGGEDCGFDWTGPKHATHSRAVEAMPLAPVKMRVPHDVSIVGFDDVPEAEHLSPPLTTVRQDFEHIGRDMLSVLLGRINGDGSPLPASVPALIERSSTRRLDA